VTKIYLALASGRFAQATGEIEAAIASIPFTAKR
jgi:23S rRNA-/tRNA-specific pseudouridylate synthase